MNSVIIVLPILTILMFDLGLTLNLSDFKTLAHHPRAVIAGMTGQLLFLPLIAWLLGNLFGLEPVYFIGLMLIACSPGGSSSNIFSMLAGGNVALSVSLTALSSILTLFTIPIIMQLTTAAVGTGADISLPVGSLIMQNVLLMLIPIAAGITLRRFREAIAIKINHVLSKVAFPALMLLAAIFFIQYRSTIISEFSELGSCVTTLILIAMGTGWGLVGVGVAYAATVGRPPHARNRGRNAERSTGNRHGVEPIRFRQRHNGHSGNHLRADDERRAPALRLCPPQPQNPRQRLKTFAEKAVGD